MNLKRIIFPAVAATVALTMLSACSGAANNSTSNTDSSETDILTDESGSIISSDDVSTTVSASAGITAVTENGSYSLIDMTIFERNTDNELLTQTTLDDLEKKSSVDKSGMTVYETTYTASAEADSVTLSLILGTGGSPASASGKVFYRADGKGTYESNYQSDDGSTARLILTVVFE